MPRTAPSDPEISAPSVARRLRQAAGVLAVAALLAILPGGNPAARIRASLRAIRATASLDLPSRRLAGRGPAYDRRFFELVLAARGSLPPGAKGVALYAPGIPEWGGRYLAIYELAPIPVVASPTALPPGWVALVYGPERPAAWQVVRELPGGALLAAAP